MAVPAGSETEDSQSWAPLGSVGRQVHGGGVEWIHMHARAYIESPHKHNNSDKNLWRQHDPTRPIYEGNQLPVRCSGSRTPAIRVLLPVRVHFIFVPIPDLHVRSAAGRPIGRRGCAREVPLGSRVRLAFVFLISFVGRLQAVVPQDPLDLDRHCGQCPEEHEHHLGPRRVVQLPRGLEAGPRESEPGKAHDGPHDGESKNQIVSQPQRPPHLERTRTDGLPGEE